MGPEELNLLSGKGLRMVQHLYADSTFVISCSQHKNFIRNLEQGTPLEPLFFRELKK